MVPVNLPKTLQMNKFKQIWLATLLVPVYISGCSTCVYPDSKATIAPDWVCSGQLEGIEYSAVGYAEKSAAGEGFMKQLAASNARSALANKQSGNVNDMVRSDGQGTTTRLTKEVLINARIIKTATSPTGRLYVLVGIVP